MLGGDLTKTRSVRLPAPSSQRCPSLGAFRVLCTLDGVLCTGLGYHITRDQHDRPSQTSPARPAQPDPAKAGRRRQIDPISSSPPSLMLSSLRPLRLAAGLGFAGPEARGNTPPRRSRASQATPGRATFTRRGPSTGMVCPDPGGSMEEAKAARLRKRWRRRRWLRSGTVCRSEDGQSEAPVKRTRGDMQVRRVRRT